MNGILRIIAIGGAVLLGASFAGIGTVGSSHAAGGHAPIRHVQAKEVHNRYFFAQRHITIAKGTTVVWTNRSDAAHNVTFMAGTKVNKDFKAGQSVKFTFTKSGTYAYHCEYHPYMTGTVTVK